MKPYGYTILLLGALLLTAREQASAQLDDVVWYVEWDRYLEGRDGQRGDYPPLKVWFDSTRVYVETSKDRYFTITNDSIYLVDHFVREYSAGPSKDVDMFWITNLDLTWKRRRGEPVTFEFTNNRKSILNIPGQEVNSIIKVNANQFIRPVRLNMYVGQIESLPVPPEAVSYLYTAFTLSQIDFSIDIAQVSDSLERHGVIPLTTAIISLNPRDTFAVLKSELIRIERQQVRKDFFLPPSDYAGTTMRSPTDAQRWEMIAIPMPGGPRKEE